MNKTTAAILIGIVVLIVALTAGAWYLVGAWALVVAFLGLLGLGVVLIAFRSPV